MSDRTLFRLFCAVLLTVFLLGCFGLYELIAFVGPEGFSLFLATWLLLCVGVSIFRK